MTELLKKLLALRGITTEEDIETFLFPDYAKHVLDPMLLSDMDKVVARIIKALRDEEKIKVFTDFDADGIPSAVLMNDALTKLGAKDFSISIPHRNTEGFGLNERVVDECIDNGVKLLITIDCGMGDATRIDRAMAAGIDVIVIDHHQEGEEGAPKCIVVNPNKIGDEYPNKSLCGAGVAYKVVQAVIAQLRVDNDPRVAEIPFGWEKWLLDMVGIATLSDMVALVGENRALAHYGLMVLRKSPRPGIRALCDRARIRQRYLTDDDVVFTITPRINAASRMDEPEAAFRLLAATTMQEADLLAEHLEGVNNSRKGAVASMTKEINAMLASREEIPSVVVVGNTHWRPGLLGLAATKVAETYNRPAFVWGQGESTMIKGSCRSGGGVDIMLLMTEAKECFVEYGGHKHSGGFSTTVQHIVRLEESLSGALDRAVAIAQEEEPEHDAELALSDVNYTMHTDVQRMAPFGAGNKKPIFLFKDCLVSNAEPFGKEKQHTRLTLGENGAVSAIQFFSDEKLKGVRAGETVSLLAHIEEDAFGKRRGIRLRIVDILS
ncbi:MAG: single-stranded-DNA-specific exonuclease [Patescibacteria group bacterium]|jgi:single-stranded-DNA-specific exonuclease|nr:single-stranded-DNA-specific exonuclease [Patescibacteria group bacterium]